MCLVFGLSSEVSHASLVVLPHGILGDCRRAYPVFFAYDVDGCACFAEILLRTRFCGVCAW